MEIEILARAVIRKENKILICRNIEDNYYFLPGGHIDFGEKATKGLLRELKEELGVTSVKKVFYIGTSEHTFKKAGKKYHELNLVFEVEVPRVPLESKEPHISFVLMDKQQILKRRVLPRALKFAILKWTRDKKTFWISAN